MTVREFLSLWVDNVSIKIYSASAAEQFHNLNHCQTDTVDVLINSNKDFLDYYVENLQLDGDLITVVCKERIEK